MGADMGWSQEASPTMGRWRRNWALLMVSALYLCLSLGYSLANPPFEANDELAHYLYIRHLTSQRRLPVQETPAGNDYQNHHPPLYYLLGALASFWVDDSDLTAITERGNPFWGYDPWAVGRDNKNQYLYGPFERFPGSGSVHRLRLVRFVSTVLGLGTVLATYGAAREVFPDQRDSALGALAFVAFHPMFLYLSGAINNDNLVVLWGACSTWGLMRLLRRGFSWPRILTLGAVLGLALITKISAVFLFPAVAVGLLLTAWRWRAWTESWRMALAIGLSVLVLAGWWFVRNHLVYGDVTGMKVLLSSIEGITYPSRPSLWQGFRATIRFQKSFWACFGWNTIPVPYVIYWALDGVVLIAIGGVFLLVCRAWRRGDGIRLAQVGVLALLVALFILAWALYMTVSRTAGYGRYAFPALAAMGVLLFGGLAQYVSSQWRPLLAWAVHAAMFSFALFSLTEVLIPAYARPRLMERAEIEAIPRRLNFDYGGKIGLLGCDVQPRVAKPGEQVVVTLYWQALQTMKEDHIVYVHLFGQKGDKIGQRDTYPGLGRLPTTLWRPGDAFADSVRVPIYPDSGAPVMASVEIGLYARDTKERLPAFDSQGRALGQTVIGRVKVPPPEGEAVVIPYPIDYTFEDGIALTGYEIVRPPVGEWEVTLYWQARGHPSRDYTTFVHLVDEEGNIVAQGDGPPLNGDYPTGAWAPGELVVDRHSIVFGPAMARPAAGYRQRLHWRVGLYDLGSMQRLPVYGPDGLRLRADQIELEIE
jgi:4-amino-4-deoxy-L-arabinose transferase-like glycosyltransferase